MTMQISLELATEIYKKNKNIINYIGSLSFEDRDLAGIKWLLNYDPISSSLRRKKLQLNVFFLVDETTYTLTVALHRITAEKLLKLKEIPFHFIPCNFHDPEEPIRKLQERDPEVFFRFTYLDTTTFTRNLEIRILEAFKKTPGYCIYFEPLDYGSDLSCGLEDIRRLPDKGVRNDSSKENVLLLLTGHEIDRPVHLAEQLDPDRLVLLVPQGDDTMDHAKWNREAQKTAKQISNEISLNKSHIETCYTSSHLYQTILCDLYEFRKKYSGCNLSISSMGTKISNLALQSVISNDPDIKVYNAIPEVYNTIDYSRGAKTRPYAFPLKLDDRLFI